MTGISSDGTRLLMPLCGLSYRDITSCAGMSQKEAAKRLGVNYNAFNQVVKRHGISHWFPKPVQKQTQCITAEDIIQVASEGYTQKDAAAVLEVSESWFKALVARWKLNHLFPSCGKASYIGRVGYCN
jgi:transposase